MRSGRLAFVLLVLAVIANLFSGGGGKDLPDNSEDRGTSSSSAGRAAWIQAAAPRGAFR